MDTEVLREENTAKTKYQGEHVVKIVNIPELEVNNHIPDYIQKTIIEGMDRIEDEIYKHQEAIKELEKLYRSHAQFLKTYSPFISKGDLSQIQLETAPKSPEAVEPPAEGRTDG